jgi:hypothetical protein
VRRTGWDRYGVTYIKYWTWLAVMTGVVSLDGSVAFSDFETLSCEGLLRYSLLECDFFGFRCMNAEFVGVSGRDCAVICWHL